MLRGSPRSAPTSTPATPASRRTAGSWPTGTTICAGTRRWSAWSTWLETTRRGSSNAARPRCSTSPGPQTATGSRWSVADDWTSCRPRRDSSRHRRLLSFHGEIFMELAWSDAATTVLVTALDNGIGVSNAPVRLRTVASGVVSNPTPVSPPITFAGPGSATAPDGRAWRWSRSRGTRRSGVVRHRHDDRSGSGRVGSGLQRPRVVGRRSVGGVRRGRTGDDVARLDRCRPVDQRAPIPWLGARVLPRRRLPRPLRRPTRVSPPRHKAGTLTGTVLACARWRGGPPFRRWRP